MGRTQVIEGSIPSELLLYSYPCLLAVIVLSHPRRGEHPRSDASQGSPCGASLLSGVSLGVALRVHGMKTG